MKRNRGKSRRALQVLQTWTYDQVQKVLPYIASIMRSLREYRLEAVRYEQAALRLAQKPGRPDRAALLKQGILTKNAQEAQERFQEALEELHALDIYCQDPIQGTALIPFAHQEELAWYIYELFGNEPIRFWRYHRDAAEKLRPVGQLEKEPPLVA